ncbi:radical SAM protein [Pengzhenrongella phosphoraccumulans]|uniref:radical SAM protein n=1 Tax=Pengzhenrongella phosphoraccumulans TaxID=3114394 RepID=UPI00388EC8B3
MTGQLIDLDAVVRAGGADAALDGGDQDCGSGLLLSLTSAMRRLEPGQVLAVGTRERSVLVDLPAWAGLAGHDLLEVVDGTEKGGGGRSEWLLRIRRGGLAPSAQFTTGNAVPLGERLWLQTNFHCNLACTYCCAQSSPKASARMMPPELARVAVEEFVAGGGRELLLTGGEPFLHPGLGQIVAHAAKLVPVTILTNAMVFDRGARRAMLQEMDRDRVALQVSLDSATPDLHDRIRGAGSHARAIQGIRLASGLGFRVRVAATLGPDDVTQVHALHALLDDLGIAADDRLVRPVAQEGAAELGVHISLETIEPELTLTVDGAWWHPVGITNPHLKISNEPVPIAPILAVIKDVLAVQAAGTAQGRNVFRCT